MWNRVDYVFPSSLTCSDVKATSLGTDDMPFSFTSGNILKRASSMAYMLEIDPPGGQTEMLQSQGRDAGVQWKPSRANVLTRMKNRQKNRRTVHSVRAKKCLRQMNDSELIGRRRQNYFMVIVLETFSICVIKMQIDTLQHTQPVPFPAPEGVSVCTNQGKRCRLLARWASQWCLSSSSEWRTPAAQTRGPPHR